MIRSILHLLGELFLWLAALLGGISILLVILGWAMNISLIMFRTGSMEPTIPTGAVAVVQERVIQMQGDANETEDPYPYTFTEARVSLFHVPHLANAVNQLNNPYLLGLITLVAAAGVGWGVLTPRAGPAARLRTEGPVSAATACATTAAPHNSRLTGAAGLSPR